MNHKPTTTDEAGPARANSTALLERQIAWLKRALGRLNVIVQQDRRKLARLTRDVDNLLWDRLATEAEKKRHGPDDEAAYAEARRRATGELKPARMETPTCATIACTVDGRPSRATTIIATPTEPEGITYCTVCANNAEAVLRRHGISYERRSTREQPIQQRGQA